MNCKYVLAFALALGGCGHQVVTVPAATPSGSAVKEVRQLSDDDKIALLRVEAKKRGFKWKIFCTKWHEGDPEGYLGAAWRANEKDEPTSDRWLQSAGTQADAAYALYLSIQSGPTHPAETPQKVEQERKPFICPTRNLTSEDAPGLSRESEQQERSDR